MPDPQLTADAEALVRHAERELEALVAVSSPSGDVRAAEEAVAVASALLPDEAEIERLPCSSPDHAPDLLARLTGTGTGRIVLLGHLDTVHSHADHQPPRRVDGRLYGSGTADMKGGVVLALGVLRALARTPERFAEAALLLVVDEEWRDRDLAHARRFAGWDACLCFEAGQLSPDGEEGVVVRRKAAGTLKVEAEGRPAHSGSAPDRGRNALLALAAAAQVVAEHHDPRGPLRLTAVPTVLRSGEAFNVVPANGELFCDLRADSDTEFARVRDALPSAIGGASLRGEMIRVWPSMDAREATVGLLAAASERLGYTVAPVERGGASDASHVARHVPVTVDGLGPRGGGAHTLEEFIALDSMRVRAEIALAVAYSALSV
jgi:glutamate carboxypeptidase